MKEEAGGFIGRWSRRKSGLPEAGSETVEPATRLPSQDAVPGSVPAPVESPLAPVAPADAAAPEPVVMPTMADVAALTHGSDYSRFVMTGVDPGVRNAAMKRLFSDPHFNVMDGLDTYIDDYGKPDPIPLSMLRLMNQATTLGLFDAEDEASPDGAAPATVAQSNETEPLPAEAEPPAFPRALATEPDDDPDLQLQQDDAARQRGAGSGPRA